MSEIASVRIEYRDDCFQIIRLKDPLPEEYAETVACMILVMRNGERCTPDSVEFMDALGETVRCLEKRSHRRVEGS